MVDRPGFSIDRSGVKRLHQSPEAGRACLGAARAIQSVGEAIAPVDTGEYQGSFDARQESVPTMSRLGGNYSRAGAVVENTAGHAAVVESRDQVLARAIAQARI